MAVPGAGKRAPVLIVVGGDDPDRVERRAGRTAYGGSTDLIKLLGPTPFDRITIGRNLLRQARRPDFSGYRCVINLIAEPENNARSLDALRKLVRGSAVPVRNRPDKVLATRRDLVARSLQGVDNLVVPRVARLPSGDHGKIVQAIERAGLRWPLIVRPLGTHGGRIVGLYEGPDALPPDLAGEHLAIEFVDFRSADGLYRKHRIFFIGDAMILRHRILSDHWNVHARDRARFMAGRPELVAEEAGLFDDPSPLLEGRNGAALRTVRDRIGLDFFGMDFGLTADGQILLFEANAAMSILPFSDDPQFAYLRRCLPPAQAAFRAMAGVSA